MFPFSAQLPRSDHGFGALLQTLCSPWWTFFSAVVLCSASCVAYPIRTDDELEGYRTS